MRTKIVRSITVDPAVWEAVKVECAERGLSVSEVAEEMLRLFLRIPGGDDEVKKE